ncbi:ABC transporter substrate-binding protein [Corynebacterium mendelii]|uniref:ABC transporter substrate-binding protein n=1 Tax=Corynebacterium mendelii TaxID=2765362 RepID=A0A939E0L6_9CORY|nr:ABC transporter substrate-binding protein [Corynebacterium mendelii]MBN9644488.1 ABC transporter substrate-binding protein [Corynebacterium mendelii]
MTIYTRKTLAALGAATLTAAVALSGCSSDAGSSDSSSDGSSSTAAAEATTEASADKDKDKGKEMEAGRGPITFAMGKNDTDKLKPVIADWNKEHPDEKVTLKELAGEADAQRETLVQSLQAKSGEYDVMALDVVWTAEFAANQWLEPLEGDMAVDTSKLLKPTVDSATYAGKLYAMPQNTNGQLLFRNTELVPEAPKDFAQLAADCTNLPDGTDCLITQLKQYEGLTVNTAGFIEGAGGHIVGDDGKTPEVTSAESMKGLETMVGAYKDGVIAKAATGANEETTHLTFIEGKSAFAINWPYMYDMAKTNDSSTVKDHFDVQPLGKDTLGFASTLGGYNNGINPFSENKLTARDFVEFITNEKNQKSFAEASFPPVLASIYDDADLIKDYPFLPALKQSLENAVPRPVSPFYPAISKAIQDNAYAALNGDKSVEDASKDMEAAIGQANK